MTTISTSSTSEVYSNLKSELVQLLAEAEDLSNRHSDYFLQPQESGKTSADEIAEVRNRLNSNQFNIVLCGAFQSGKSTTFNALCGGRELSPVGFGMTTSGCIVKAINLPDPTTKEYAEVHGKSPQTLILGMEGLLGSRLADIAFKNQCDIGNAVSLLQWFKLENPQHVQWLREAINEEFRNYEANRVKYNLEDLKFLHVSKIIADFADNKEVQNLISGKPLKMSIDAAEAYIKCPTDWDDRCLGGHSAKFKLEEIRFIFVQEVHLFIHAPHLQRLGCVIVDAPGLFSSKWDSLIAQGAFDAADAIFFLFEGSRTITESDMKILKEIQKAGGESKVFIGCNLRGQNLSNTERLLRSSLSKLENAGFKVRKDSAAIYHARIALKSRQLMVELTDTDTKSLGSDMNAFCQQLLADLAQDIVNFPDSKKLVDSTMQSAEACYRTSRLPALVDQMETFILTRRARFALVERGSMPLSNVFQRVEGGLKLEENSADLKVEEEKQLFKEADEILRQFEEKVSNTLTIFAPNSKKRQKKLDFPILNSLETSLKEKFGETAAFAEGGIGDSIAKEIADEVFGKKMAQIVLNSPFDSDKRKNLIQKEIIEPILKRLLTPAITDSIKSFHNDFVDPKKEHGSLFIDFINRIQKEIINDWVNTVESNAILDDLFIEETVISENENLTAIIQNPARSLNAHMEGSGFVAVTGAVILALTTAVTTVVAIILATGPLAPIILATITLGYLIAGNISGFEQKASLAKSLKKEWPKIEEQIYETSKQAYREKIILPLLEKYLSLTKTNAEKPRREFENRKEKAEKRWQMAEDARKKLAEKAHAIRVGEIAPVRERTTEFLERAAAAFPLD